MAATLAIPQTADSAAELRNMRFGYPLHFVEAELAYSPPAYPQTYGFNPWEHPADVLAERFLLDWALVTLLLFSPLLLATRSRRSSTRG